MGKKIAPLRWGIFLLLLSAFTMAEEKKLLLGPLRNQEVVEGCGLYLRLEQADRSGEPFYFWDALDGKA
jgi:hypothetical protein